MRMLHDRWSYFETQLPAGTKCAERAKWEQANARVLREKAEKEARESEKSEKKRFEQIKEELKKEMRAEQDALAQSLVDQLRDLKAMHRAGKLTNDEFQEAKANILIRSGWASKTNKK